MKQSSNVYIQHVDLHKQWIIVSSGAPLYGKLLFMRGPIVAIVIVSHRVLVRWTAACSRPIATVRSAKSNSGPTNALSSQQLLCFYVTLLINWWRTNKIRAIPFGSQPFTRQDSPKNPVPHTEAQQYGQLHICIPFFYKCVNWL